MGNDKSVHCMQPANVPNPGPFNTLPSSPPFLESSKVHFICVAKGVGVSREDWNICGLTTKELECPSLNWLMLPTTLKPFLPSFPSRLFSNVLFFVGYFFFHLCLCPLLRKGVLVTEMFSVSKALYPANWEIINMHCRSVSFCFEPHRGVCSPQRRPFLRRRKL